LFVFHAIISFFILHDIFTLKANLSVGRRKEKDITLFFSRKAIE